MDKIRNHNPSFGYNTFEGFVEEDCVQALDQIINEDLGLATEPRKRWQLSDDGIHVLAVALYQLMRKEHFPEHPGNGFRGFPIDQIRKGNLDDSHLRELNEGYRQGSSNSFKPSYAAGPVWLTAVAYDSLKMHRHYGETNWIITFTRAK